MRQTTQITIEHMVVASDRSYEQVIEALEAQLGLRADWEKIARALIMPNATFEQAVQIVEQQLGTSGFTILSKIEPGALLRLSGKPTRATQYAIGNPLLAIQMIEHAKDTAFYAPLRLVVYENRVGNAVVAYERFTGASCEVTTPCNCTGRTDGGAKAGRTGSSGGRRVGRRHTLTSAATSGDIQDIHVRGTSPSMKKDFFRREDTRRKERP